MRNKIKYLTSNFEEQIVLSNVLDRYEKVIEYNYIQHSNFLTQRECYLVKKLFDNSNIKNYFLWGGYEDSQRNICVIFPEYINDKLGCLKEYDPLYYMRIILPKGYSLKHSDYLGSLMALGIERKLIGEILVNDTGCDIVCLKNIGEYLIKNFTKAARVSFKVEELADYSYLTSPKYNVEEKRVYMPSLRLDAYISCVYGLSRSKAQDYIEKGLVTINTELITKSTKIVKEKDVINVRKHGRTSLKEVAGKTKKDNIISNVMIWK